MRLEDRVEEAVLLLEAWDGADLASLMHAANAAEVALLLITEADTKLEAVKVLRDAGLVVEHLLVLIDRCQGGSDTMTINGVSTHSVYQLPILLVGYVEAGLIDQALATKVLDYLRG